MVNIPYQRRPGLVLALGVLTWALGMTDAHARDLPQIDSLWDYNDPAATEARFRELLPQAGELPDRRYEAELLTQLARSLGLQQKFDSAHTVLDGVEPLLGQAGPRVQTRYLLERGRTFNSSGSRDQADSLFLQAWEHAQRHGETALAVDAAHMVAITRPSESLEWNLRALEVAEHATDPAARRWRGSLYNNLGWTYFERKQYDSAHRCFDLALTCRVEQGKTRDVLEARWCLAKCLRFEEQVEASLAMQLELEQAWEREGTQDGFVYEEIAECLWQLGRTAESRPYFARAHELLSQDPWLARDETERLKRLLQNSLP
jgi:tetratricopeptide (TPR) repeat protein